VPICNQSGNIEFSYICRHLSRLYSVITMQLGFTAACFHVLTLFSCLKRVLVSLSVNRIQCFSMFVYFCTFAFYPLFRSKFSHWTFRILPIGSFRIFAFYKNVKIFLKFDDVRDLYSCFLFFLLTTLMTSLRHFTITAVSL
jgi:hypothetical protein